MKGRILKRGLQNRNFNWHNAVAGGQSDNPEAKGKDDEKSEKTDQQSSKQPLLVR